MTLISLILVLAAERVTAQSQYWQADFYLAKLHHQHIISRVLSDHSGLVGLLSLVLLPCFILYVLLSVLDNSLLRLITDTAILLVCVGCPSLRATYKNYLQAANRGDMQACSMYADQLGHEEDSIGSFGQNLVWLNFKHYAAVIIWFAAFGPIGAVFYVLVRNGRDWLEQQQHDALASADKLMEILDWVPVRITALGFLIVGHFSRALPVWLMHVADPTISAKSFLRDVSKAAEEIEPDENDCTEEPCTLVRLAKRNVMFLVVLISIMSLSGWLR